MAASSRSGRAIPGFARRALAAALSAALVGAAGCGAKWTRGPVEPRLAPGAALRVGPGDLLRVEIWGDGEVTRRVTIGPDGRATVPLLGPVPLAGRTVTEVADTISTGLKRYIREPVASVALLDCKSQRVEVLGEVYEPGTYSWYEGDTVVTAVERAQGFIPATAAFWRVHLIRGALERPRVYKVDLERLLDGEPGVEDVPVEPGDIIYVPPRWATSFDRFVAQAFGPLLSVLGMRGDIEDVSRSDGFVLRDGLFEDRYLVPQGSSVGTGTGTGTGPDGGSAPPPLPPLPPLPGGG
jgi:polysaccharide export outer membrane protein